MTENNEYILGTNKDELSRLELQHKVWLSEAKYGWDLAEFTKGQNILDLGCGPGYCTEELARIVGKKGRVIGVDKSNSFISHLNQIRESSKLSIKPYLVDFNSLILDNNSLDGVYCRWALAWTSNPKEILSNVKNALKPGGRIVIQEYYQVSTLKTNPERPSLRKAIKSVLNSFHDSDFKIDMGSFLPEYFVKLGMKINHLRLISKLATPGSIDWEWPKSFFYNYFPRLVSMGYLNNQDIEYAIEDLKELELLSYSTLCCPLVIEVIAEK
tara:strand:- start:2695 stop:3504 length:810 start_codon:yes stop_codon:yes gene_type:complete